VRDRLKASQVHHHVYFRYTPCLTDFTFEFIRRPTTPILSPSYWTFVELTLVNNTLCYSDISKQFWHFSKQHPCFPIILSEFRIHSNAWTNLKSVTLRLVNNVDLIDTPLRSIIICRIWKSLITPTYSTMNPVIAWTINIVPNSFCLAIYHLFEIRSLGIIHT
jgi:hypothetical protein